MPFTKEDLDIAPISFCKENEVEVIVGPCSARSWSGGRIPLDGRKYHCGGQITFKNGQSYRASFYVDTTTFSFLVRESIYLIVQDVWYNLQEEELLTELNITQADIYPISWCTDRPLDYHVQAPYTLEA